MGPEQIYELAEQLQGRPVPGVRMSESEYLKWAFTPEFKSEWVDGEVILMAPVSDVHSDVNLWLVALVRLFIEEHDLGEIRSDMFVRLANQRRLRVPDLLFIAKEHKGRLHRTYVDGAPDLVIEIISPDSQSRDRREKFQEYERAGAREYWILDPLSSTFEAYRLDGKKFRRISEQAGIVRSSVLRNLWLKPEWFWRKPLPKVSGVLKQLRTKSSRR